MPVAKSSPEKQIPEQFIEKTALSLKRYGLVKFGDKVLIAVSGGPDSLALLFSLNALKERFGLKLYIAHLDHGLRKNSYQDLLYVKSIAKQLAIPFLAKKINLNKAKKGCIEEIARDARIDFLLATAKKIKADKIALGHNKDDLAETVLMRIIRGSGLYGLSSILPKRKIKGFTFIRPLIETERLLIESFLKKIKVKPLQDPTNFETRFFRNRIRQCLLPLIAKEYNPQIKESLSHLAQICASDYDLLESLAVRSLGNCQCRLRNQAITLDLHKLMLLNKSLQRMVIRLAIEKISSSLRRFDFRHWQEIEELIYSRPALSIVHLPRQISVSKQKGKIVITAGKT